MTDWRKHLRDAVGPADGDRLSDDAARAMRRVVVAAARGAAANDALFSWKRPLAFAATIVLMIAVGITAGRRIGLSLPEPSGIANDAADPPAVENPVRPNRQLQFSTPGGTRIIWVFNSNLDLKATIP